MTSGPSDLHSFICEADFADPCTPNPCVNSEQCVPINMDYMCLCDFGNERGKNCDLGKALYFIRFLFICSHPCIRTTYLLNTEFRFTMFLNQRISSLPVKYVCLAWGFSTSRCFFFVLFQSCSRRSCWSRMLCRGRTPKLTVQSEEVSLKFSTPTHLTHSLRCLQMKSKTV